MNWLITLKKAGLGFITFVVGYLASNPGVITNLIPANIATMSVGGVIAAALVALSNWLKHRDD